MCSGSAKISAQDEQLQAANTTAAEQYTADAGLAFKEQQSVLNGLNTRMQYIANNPMGYTPQELHTMTTGVNENTANAAKQAIGSAAAFAAAHGAADVGGGSIGQIAGEIGSAAAQSKAQQLTGIAQQSEALKRQNMWSALSGLSGVGSELGNAEGTSIGGGGTATSGAVNAGAGALQANMAGWDTFGSILSGAAGLAKAGVGAYSAYNQPG